MKIQHLIMIPKCLLKWNNNKKEKKMNYEKLSKEVSYALRHAPWEYELEMDEEGWVVIKR